MKAMRSWRKSVWFRRIFAAVVLAAAVLLYRTVTGWLEESRAVNEENIAQATAAAWVNSAKFRADPEKYLTNRDSLLKERGLSADKIGNFFDKYEDSPEQYLEFGERGKQIVDSLVIIEDSTNRANQAKDIDSSDSTLDDSAGTLQ